MKIGVIGAAGKAGSHIVREALLRRHEVTAIVRDRKKLTETNVSVLEKDLYDLTAEDLKGFDAVVDAFGEFVKSDGVLESMPNSYKEKQVH